MTHKGFYFNQSVCVGCRTCQVACKDKNDLPVGTLYRTVGTFESGVFPTAAGYHLSIACNHCENPACVRACPTGAMYIDDADGTVQHDDERCIGCKSCVMACPYDAPTYRAEMGIVGKCNACKELRDAGEQVACVASCPMRALEFGDIDELARKHPDAVNGVAALRDPSMTDPSLRIQAKKAALEEKFQQVII